MLSTKEKVRRYKQGLNTVVGITFYSMMQIWNITPAIYRRFCRLRHKGKKKLRYMDQGFSIVLFQSLYSISLAINF